MWKCENSVEVAAVDMSRLCWLLLVSELKGCAVVFICVFELICWQHSNERADQCHIAL